MDANFPKIPIRVSGYSVGKWDGDTLVVDTSGFNDDEWILPGRRPHSEALHIIEHYRRRDFDHLEIQYTIDDPKVYAKPWNIDERHRLTPERRAPGVHLQTRMRRI